MSSPPPAPARAAHPNEVLLVLLMAGVSFALSQTLVIPALPEIGDDLDASATATSWLLTAFLLSASIATPIVGKLGDIYGKGRVLTAVLLVFAAGAVVCALGRTIEVVIAGRVLQGVAGGVFPLAFGIVRDTFPRERIPAGLGMVSAIFGIGGGIGLPLSGVIVDNLDTQLAVLDQPDRAPGRARRVPAHPAAARRPPPAHRLGRRRAAVRRARPRSCSASRRPTTGAGGRPRTSA